MTKSYFASILTLFWITLSGVPGFGADRKNDRKPRAEETASDVEDTPYLKPPTAPATKSDGTPAPSKKMLDGIEKLRKDWIIPELPVVKADTSVLKDIQELILRDNPVANPWTVPGAAAVIPTGFGAQWTDVFGGGVLATQSRYATRPDGTAFFGMGFGDAANILGLEVSLAAYSIIPPFRSGAVSAKIHRLFPKGFAAAIGREGLIQWKSDTGSSWYGVVSKFHILKEDETKWFSMVFFHLGVGDGRFNTEQNLIDGKNNANLFGGVALRVLQPLGVILNWDGQQLIPAIAIAPFHKFPLHFTAAVLNVINNPIPDRTRFTFVLAWGDSWNSPNFPTTWFGKGQINSMNGLN